jgi:hypothetical protein
MKALKVKDRAEARARRAALPTTRPSRFSQPPHHQAKRTPPTRRPAPGSTGTHTRIKLTGVAQRASQAQPQRKQKQNEQRGIRAGGEGDYVGEGLEGADEVPVPAHPELVRLHGGEQRRRRRRFSPAAPRRATAAHLARKLREEEGGGSAELAEREVGPAAVGGVESLRCSALLPSGWGGFGMVELLLRPPPSGWSRRGLVGCDHDGVSLALARLTGGARLLGGLGFSTSTFEVRSSLDFIYRFFLKKKKRA